MLPTLLLPLTLNVPLTLAPVPETTNIFALPPTLVVTLPLTPMISTLLVPFAILPTVISPAFNVPVTERFPKVVLPPALNVPAVVKFPPVIVPLALNVPDKFALDELTMNTFGTPATLVVTLPLIPIISTLLVPFAIEETVISPASNVPVTVRFLAVSVPLDAIYVRLASPSIAPLLL